MTAYKTLSSFIEAPTVAETDYFVGYTFPMFDGERRWKWSSIVKQITADMLGEMEDGELLIGDSSTGTYQINTLSAGTGINIVNGNGTIGIKTFPAPPIVIREGDMIDNGNNTFTFEITDDMHGQMIVINSFFPVLIPLSQAQAVGLDISIIRGGLGSVTFTAANLVVDVRTTPDNTFTQLAFTNSVAGAYHAGAGVWYLFGDLLPA